MLDLKFRSAVYLNGNYLVKTSSYGNSFFSVSKRALRIGEELYSEFPDSIDLKISNRCSHGCPFCHESSIKDGDILDLEKTKQILSQLPQKPIEIAIGGGNVLECLEETSDIIKWIEDRGYLTRLTITLGDLNSTKDMDKDKEIKKVLSMVSGIGISITSPLSSKMKRKGILRETDLGEYLEFGPSIVYHVIAGITPLEDIRWLIEKENSVLILGYKQWGRAINTKLPDMNPLKDYFKDLFKGKPTGRGNIGFDNLAIEQLGIKELLGESLWNKIYLGDEGTCSMYIDAVKGEFARTSRSPERISWDKIKLLDYYASLNPKRKI